MTSFRLSGTGWLTWRLSINSGTAVLVQDLTLFQIRWKEVGYRHGVKWFPDPQMIDCVSFVNRLKVRSVALFLFNRYKGRSVALLFFNRYKVRSVALLLFFDRFKVTTRFVALFFNRFKVRSVALLLFNRYKVRSVAFFWQMQSYICSSIYFHRQIKYPVDLTTN